MTDRIERVKKPVGQISTYNTSWKMNELTEQVIRVIWGLWGPGIDKDKNNAKAWKPFKDNITAQILV